MPRFAILEHDFPHLHWDLLLEAGSACRTWRLSAPPWQRAPRLPEHSPQSSASLRPPPPRKTEEPGIGAIHADALPDHRLMYLDYEGPVSGNRGTVTRRDGGTFTWITARTDRVVVLLDGDQASGRLELDCRQNEWQADFVPRQCNRPGKPRPAV